MTAVKWRMPRVSRRVGAVVAVVVPVTVLMAVLVPLAPRIVVADAGRHVVVGGARLPAAAPGTSQPDAVTWFAAGVEITNAGMLPVRITNPRVVTVDDDARVSVRVQLPRTGAAPQAGEPVATDGGAVVGRGGTAELWVTIGQPGCAPGGSSRIERGFQGIVVDVSSLGLTRAVTLDVDLAAYVESGGGPLPPCG
jgi:hypothetical protein